MFIQDIFVDLEMTGMVEVMFRPPTPPPTPSNFLLKHCAVEFSFGRLSFAQGFRIYMFFCILMAHCDTIFSQAFVILGLNT